MKQNQLKAKIAPYALIAPAMIGIFMFTVFPMFRLIQLSLYETNMLNSSKTKFVGLKNFVKVFERQAFIKALSNTAIYSLFSILIVLGLALVLSVWLGHRTTKMNSLTQIAIFTPHVISMVSVALVWLWMMEPRYGLLNTLLQALNMEPLKWLQSSETSLMSIILVSSWKSIGYYTVILIASLQSIPKSIYEAAELDNAGSMRTFFKITLPMISPQIFFSLIVLTIGSFKVFETIRVMTAGGPNNSTSSLVYLIYQEVFTNSRIGYGAAVGVVLLFIVGILTAVYFLGLSKKVHYQ